MLLLTVSEPHPPPCWTGTGQTGIETHIGLLSRGKHLRKVPGPLSAINHTLVFYSIELAGSKLGVQHMFFDFLILRELRRSRERLKGEARLGKI